MTNNQPGASGPIIYGLALTTPPRVVDDLAAALARYHRRIGSRWRAHDAFTQAVLTCAFLEGGHTYRRLGEGNGVPRSTCYTYIHEGIKVLAGDKPVTDLGPDDLRVVGVVLKPRRRA